MKLISFLLITSYLFALSQEQKQNLRIVHDEASKWTNFPTTIAAQCLVESSGGKKGELVGKYDTKPTTQSLGALQFLVPTVRFLITKYPKTLKYIKHLTDYEIAIKLLKDIRFNAKLAALHFEYYNKRVGYFKAISIFNGGFNNRKYVRKVNRAKKLILKEIKKA